ncbi:MAG: hypothetical protein OQK82_01245 [Candidatus Pacearchaeota archaeon]|nr:hypothetical protein [Candidatus Pacearchaeota archaeon]
MEISNNNYIPNKNDTIKNKKEALVEKKHDEIASDAQSDTFINDTHHLYNEVTSRVQRSITKEQVSLAGLETIRSFLESGMEKEESIFFLQDIAEKTQFDKEKVLDVYRESLVDALNQGNPEAIDELINKVQDNIETLKNELEMNELKKQNLRSLDNLSKEDNPEELMKKVISSLKENGLPSINIKRERISDLLS